MVVGICDSVEWHRLDVGAEHRPAASAATNRCFGFVGLRRCARFCHALAGICGAMDAGLAELLDSPEGNVPSVGGLFAMGKKLDRLHSAAGIGQQHGGGCVQCRVDARRGAAALAESADDVVGSVQLHDTSGASAGSPEPSRGRVIERRANTGCDAGKAAGTGRASGENRGGAQRTGDSGPRLGIAELEVARRRYMSHGLAVGTRRAYSSAQRAYLEFCERVSLSPIPTSEHTLCLFVSSLAEGRKASTIRAYLSAVRNLHVESGRGDPTTPRPPQLALVLRGIEREQAEQGRSGGDQRLPIDAAALSALRAEWRGLTDRYESALLWAATCVGFFGCLRTAEFLVNSTEEFDERRHLTYADVAVDDRENPSWARIRVKFSKTDQLGKGAFAFLGRVRDGMCPVAALLQYLALRGAGQGPLFRFPNGDPLTRRRLVAAMREVLRRRGFDADRFSGHSLQIGAATAAARVGCPEEKIKALGRWKSNAYKRYIRLAGADITKVSSSLGGAGASK